MIDRRALLSSAAAAAAAITLGPARAEAPVAAAFNALLGDDDRAYDAAIAALRARGGADLLHGLALAARYAKWRDGPIFRLMAEIAEDDRPATWLDWMEWLETRPDLPSHPGYADLKRAIYRRFDPRFDDFIGDDRMAGARIRLESVVWGGVRTDGIPPLNPPPMIPAGEASFMVGSDPVIGVEVNGDARAYPVRILAWHEMVNDVIGGVPAALPYCTLCGAGMLYDRRIDDGPPVAFGTSGLLHRSNKLMWDDRTRSLWSQFGGEPVIGPLARSGLRLRALPTVTEPWARWRERRPDSLVMSLDTGFALNYGSGYVVDRYIRSPDKIFPAADNAAANAAGRLAPKTIVFGVRTFGAAKVWPLTRFEGGKVINDRIGRTPLVLIGDRLGDTVRAYESDGRRFEKTASGVASGGARWRIGEAALTGPAGEVAPRVAGRTSYWFAWSGLGGPPVEIG